MTPAVIQKATSTGLHTFHIRHELNLCNMPGNRHMRLWIAVAAKLAIDAATLTLVDQKVPESYMDEPFHVGQTQKYCQGLYTTWDPKITTLPGLYVLGTVWAKLHSVATSLGMPLDASEPCSTQCLRWLNVILAAACMPVLHSIICFIQQDLANKQRHVAHDSSSKGKASAKSNIGTSNTEESAWLWTLTLSLMPLHWFYTHLYYTDVGSTLLLLCSLQATLASRYGLAALAGFAAVLFRQTNAVWVTFFLGVAVLRFTNKPYQTKDKPRLGTASITSELAQILSNIWQMRQLLMKKLWPLLLIPTSFVVFVVVNGGITVGDKEAHTPVKNPAQLVYFWLFSAALMWPVTLSEGVKMVSSVTKQHLIQTVIAWAVCTAVSAAALLVSPGPHPYLLADNRHYTFYIWRRILGRSKLQQLVIIAPAAGMCVVLLCRIMLRYQQRLWLSGFIACLAAVLVPAWLLEFRYYSVGFLLLALHIKIPSKAQTIAMLATFAALNAITMYLFLNKPWSWYDGSIARFMW